MADFFESDKWVYKEAFLQTHDPSGLVWVDHTGADAVPDAVYAGKETNNRQVYVARALGDRCLCSGKFIPGFGMSMPFTYGEIQPVSFQVLTNPNDAVQTKWALFEGKIPPTAVKGGLLEDEPVYVGRSKHNGNCVAGEVRTGGDGEKLKLFYGMNGREYNVEDFEILLAKKRPDCQCPLIFQLNSCASCTSYPKKKQ